MILWNQKANQFQQNVDISVYNCNIEIFAMQFNKWEQDKSGKSQ